MGGVVEEYRERMGNIVLTLLDLRWGDCTKISFWHDQWCGEVMLEVIFLVLFGLACVNDASIADNLEILNGFNHWNVNFARAAQD